MRLYREARRGELEPQTATRLAHVVALIASLLRDQHLDALELRIATLEAGR